jgi:hypothetical protein
MAEPTDVVVPMLQRIQADLVEVKQTLARHGERLSEMNGYLSFNLGITSRQTGEIETLRGEVEAIKYRLGALERHT